MCFSAGETVDLGDDDFGNSDVSKKQLLQTATAASHTPQLYHGRHMAFELLDRNTVEQPVSSPNSFYLTNFIVTLNFKRHQFT